MYIWDMEEISIIPADFNIFYESACEYKKEIRYSKDWALSEKIINSIKFHITNTDKFIAIDMRNIVSYPLRMLGDFSNIGEKVFFYNVDHVTVRQKMTEDIDDIHWIRENVACFSLTYREKIERFLDKECCMARKNKQIEIINEMVKCEENEVYYLESSGLYSNCYLNIKSLFTAVEKFYYIVFCMAEKINQMDERIDAFISSSKNGAVLANILGALMNVKEVHLIGVGPKYSMELGDTVDCIKKGKRYVYIFDFLCLGTELKIVSALINSKKAYLLYAAGIAKYKKGKEEYPVKELFVLADTKELGKPYSIMGEAEGYKINTL